jgi:hypothetical protein
VHKLVWHYGEDVSVILVVVIVVVLGCLLAAFFIVALRFWRMMDLFYNSLPVAIALAILAILILILWRSR